MIRLTIGFVAAFLLSWLPEPVKGRGRMQHLNSPSVHVVSGVFEMILGFVLLVGWYSHFMVKFNGLLAVAATNSGICLTEAELGGMGQIGFLSFLFQPLTFVIWAIIGEGLVRGLCAFLVARTPGTVVIALPYRLVLFLRERRNTTSRLAALGPLRPDELNPPERNPNGLLEVFAAREKPWPRNQVVEYGSRFFIFDNRQRIKRGEYWSICYRFRPMQPGEIIRGTLVTYDNIACKSARPD
jgi:hypothetical protein